MRRADSLAELIAGSIIEIKIPMIAMTTNSSINVKAQRGADAWHLRTSNILTAFTVNTIRSFQVYIHPLSDSLPLSSATGSHQSHEAEGGEHERGRFWHGC